MIRLALHGGAGDLPADAGPQPEHQARLLAIAEHGAALLRAGASALDVVEQVVMQLEDCPLFNAGIGAVLNRDGLPELDAAIMEGHERRAGSVTGVMRVRSPVRLARQILEHSPHLMFMGAGAEALNRELGLESVEPDTFITAPRLAQLEQARAQGRIVLDHDSAFGTVGAVARDHRGRLAAATSTGGLTNKQPGRVGDTPIIGAGTYADDRSLAVSCTGTGECFIRSCFAHEIHARLLYGGWSLAQACAKALEEVRDMGGRGGCVAIDQAGNLALPFNSRAMYRAWMGADGRVHAAIGPLA